MPRLATTRLNDTVVSRALPRSRPYEIRDSGQQGLILRVQPTGRKSWVVQVNRDTRRVIADATLIKVEPARSMARDYLSTFDEGKETGPVPTLKDYLEKRYTDWIKSRTRHGERDTGRLVAALDKLVKLKLDKLTHARIDRWMQDRDVAPATKNRELASLKAALSRAVEWNLLDTNPAARVKLVMNDASPIVRFLNTKERERLYAALDDRDGDYLSVMVRLVLNTGLRRGEVFQLDWSDINLGDHRLHVRAEKAKSGKDRHIPLNATAVSVLKAWRMKSGHREGFVFRGRAGHVRDIKRQWHKLMKAAKIEDFRFHDLRHDFASRLVQSGVDLYQVKDLLGHSTIQLTERYAHLRPEQLKDAVEILVK